MISEEKRPVEYAFRLGVSTLIAIASLAFFISVFYDVDDFEIGFPATLLLLSIPIVCAFGFELALVFLGARIYRIDSWLVYILRGLVVLTSFILFGETCQRSLSTVLFRVFFVPDPIDDFLPVSMLCVFTSLAVFTAAHFWGKINSEHA